MTTKLDFLNEINILQPDMNMIYINQLTEEKWPTEKALKDLNYEERQQVNLRKQLKNEICLDVEERIRINEIKELLDRKGWKYEIWDTGSRGVHIKLFFSNLGKLDLELRNRIRKYIINEFKCDEALAKESQWMALEYALHFKTQREKTKIEETEEGENIIPKEVIDYCIDELKKFKDRQVIVSQDFSNFLEDPFLKYCMTNQIVDGDRNDVLFKNLAIGLVKKGLAREEIVKIASVIVNNCPGKNIGEFMGWVEKAFSGHITDYNKSELMQWSKKYNHPVTYELVGEEDLERLYNAKLLWDSVWGNRITSQDVWRDMCFYNLMGVIIDERVEDYRIHPIISSDSRSGKDEGINLVKEVLDLLGFKTHKPSSVTDRTLLGAVNQTAVEMNTKNDVSEENPENGKKKFKKPTEEGILATADWIAFGESESVFKPSVYNKQVQLILRQAMDKARYVEKGVSGYMIPIRTHASFIFSTYPMPDTIYKLLNNGLFQRSLYYDKNLSEEEHRRIRRFIGSNKFNDDEGLKFSEKTYMDYLVSELKKIALWYREVKVFKNFKGSRAYQEHLWDQYEKEYSVFIYEDRKILNSIVRQAATTLYKLAVLSAIYKKQDYISKVEMDEGFKLLKACLDSIKGIVSAQNKKSKQILSILLMLKDGSQLLANIYKAMEETLGIKSPNSKLSLKNKLIDLKFVTEFQNGKTAMLMITERGLEEIGEA